MAMFMPVLSAQHARDVQLKGRMDYSPGSFYLSSVVDDRGENSIGTLRTGSERSELMLAGGADKALEQFINTGIRQNRSRQPIVLHIQNLDFDIRKRNDLWNLDCTVVLAFYAGDKLLVEYTGNGKGEINTDPVEYAGRFIRQTLESDLKKFDAWWGENSDDIPTASTVKVNFIIARSITEPDMIVYSSARPLHIGDFQGRTGRNPEEMAATFSGNKYAYSVVTEKGQLVVNYTITPYFNKAKSWFKQSEQNARVLAHEQLHFDITALKTCELVKRMRKVAFTKNNYQELLEKFSDQVSDETNALQEQYDSETNHGINTSIQAAWEARIKEELREAGCY